MLLIGVVVIIALATNLTLTLTLIMAIVTSFYFANLLITLYLSFQIFDHTSEIQIPDEIVHLLTDVEWPRYTILCPLYKEAAVVEQFANAMQQLDYPTDQLQILFLTEVDDEGTRAAIRAANLPAHFEIVVVPDGKPRTKPRACNYGLLKATGDFVVIYDAEDMPDTLQLKKAVLAFAENGLDLGCVQAKLNFITAARICSPVGLRLNIRHGLTRRCLDCNGGNLPYPWVGLLIIFGCQRCAGLALGTRTMSQRIVT